ncbi:methyl-accepting chemotaxis protein [Thiosulfativibrio zosterae]|uniref:Methyl-accepting chemotaxis protein n=1 Tax=Thiosulfativibrio zosterae TaxID=2675053 RepID=A0A6F8PPQ9_9GAMM|nr:methyl-accepting chemotaxis protein [Thiosulfativibrio zosterae]BBP44099.1 hypothetical protein THMIRHAT_18450 [Thiosulfativibrio zosterae]
MLKTIKAKLIASFIALMVIVVGLAAYSVVNIEISAKGFKDYRSSARSSVIAGQVEAELLTLRMAVKDYMLDDSSQKNQAFEQAYQTLLSTVEQAKSIITDPEELKRVGGVVQDLTDYQATFTVVQADMQKRDDIVSGILDVNGPKIEHALTAMLNQAQQLSKTQLTYDAAQALRTLLLGRVYAMKFLNSNSDADMQRVLKEFTTLNTQLQLLTMQATDEALETLLVEAETSIGLYQKGIQEINQVIIERNQLVDEKLSRLGEKITQVTQGIRSQAKSKQDTIGPKVQALNETIIFVLIVVAILASLIALTIAILIPRMIANGLDAIQAVLSKISDTGDFSIRANVDKADEIGQMGRAVNHLLSEMQQAIKEANQVVGALANGRFDKRIQANLSGDLNILKQGVNQSAQSIEETMAALSKLLDAMSEGQFDVSVQANLEGGFKTMLQNACTTTQSLNQTIGGIVNAMQKMQQGEFSSRVNVEAKGELLKLKDGVNHSMNALDAAFKEIIAVVVAQSNGDLTQKIKNQYQGDLKTLTDSVSRTSEKLVEVVSKALTATSVVNSASDEVSRGALDLSQRVQEQAAALEETSATMDEMNSQVQSNTQNALQATHVAEEVQDKANTGAKVMMQTIDAMKAIQESSHKISDIVSLIDGIAFQTNLLALNAAVEAARAGDHGRGFAVVAGEVRSLAQKSADAAKDIKKLIDETVDRVNQGSSLATESGDMLTSINESIHSVTQMITHIAQASAEQAEGVHQVHNAISQIDQATQQNAALVEETSAAAESMSEQATLLNEDMAFFNTGTTLRTPTKKPQASAAPKGTTSAKVPALSAPKSAPKSASAQPKPMAKIAAKPAAAKASSDEWGEF